VGTVATVAVAAVALGACGEKTIEADGAQDTLTGFVKRETGFVVKDASCPDDVEAKEGKTFDCAFTGPEGPYVAHMTVTDVDGSKVLFQIQTERKPGGG
jgi:hypothetical protein